MILLNVLGFLWSLPTTLFGCIWALCRGSAFVGFRRCEYGWLVLFVARLDSIDQRYLERLRFAQWEIGYAVARRNQFAGELWPNQFFLHAERHAFWAALLGPFYLPVYFILQATAGSYAANPIEVDCRKYDGSGL